MQDSCCRETSLRCHWVNIYIRLSDIKINKSLIAILNTCSVPHATLSVFHRAFDAVDCATKKKSLRDIRVEFMLHLKFRSRGG